MLHPPRYSLVMVAPGPSPPETSVRQTLSINPCLLFWLLLLGVAAEDCDLNDYFGMILCRMAFLTQHPYLSSFGTSNRPSNLVLPPPPPHWFTVEHTMGEYTKNLNRQVQTHTNRSIGFRSKQILWIVRGYWNT